jgi:hypothetical protein
MRIGVVHAIAFPFGRKDWRLQLKISAGRAGGKGPRNGISERLPHHAFVMPRPYISAINRPHVKVMGITGEKATGFTHRTRGCHTLILRVGLKNCRKVGGHQGRAN